MPVVGKPNHFLPVTPSDTTNLRIPSTWLSFTDATGGPGMGTLTVDSVGGEGKVLITLPAGMYRLCVSRVWATGTTATDIVEYWDQ